MNHPGWIAKGVVGVGVGGAQRLQRVLDIRHLNVIAVLIVAAHLEHERRDVRLDLLLRHLLHHLRHGQLHALLTLGLGHEERVQHRDALRQHRDLQLVLRLEVVEEFGQRHFALQLEAVPERPLVRVVLLGERLDRFGAREHRQGQIEKVVLVAFDVRVTEKKKQNRE